MKRVWILIFLCIFLFGCGAEKLQKPVSFYYPPTDYIHSQDGSTLDCELRETEGLASNEAILSLYLQGPENIRFSNSFPAGCSMISLQQEDGTAELTVSDELAQLTGISLMLACASLSMTCMELTGAHTVQISAQTQLLDGDEVIVMSRDTLNISSGSFANAEGTGNP